MEKKSWWANGWKIEKWWLSRVENWEFWGCKILWKVRIYCRTFWMGVKSGNWGDGMMFQKFFDLFLKKMRWNLGVKSMMFDILGLEWCFFKWVCKSWLLKFWLGLWWFEWVGWIFWGLIGFCGDLMWNFGILWGCWDDISYLIIWDFSGFFGKRYLFATKMGFDYFVNMKKI